MEAPIIAPESVKQVVDNAAVKPVAAESIDQTFNDSIGVNLQSTVLRIIGSNF